METDCWTWRTANSATTEITTYMTTVLASTTHMRFNVLHVKICAGSETRGQSNLTKSASQGAHSPVRGHPRGSKVVPLNSWGRVSY